VYHGQCYHACCFAEEVCDLHAEYPDARFVVMGFSSGVGAAVRLAESVRHAGVPIDLLISVDAPAWSTATQILPDNVHHLICTRGKIQVACCAPDPMADELVAEDGQTMTVERLVEELTSIAGTVPLTTGLSTENGTGDAPSTRSEIVRPAARRDEWDFLKPIFRLADAPRDALPSTADEQPLFRSVQIRRSE
jgi:hypothetical protein